MSITFIDVIIFVLAIGALLRGYQIGFLRQAVSTVAFVIGLFPGSWAAGLAMDYVSGPSKPLAGLAVLLAVCFIFMTIGEVFAVRAKLALSNHAVQKIDNGVGAIMSIVTLLLGLWLASSIFALAPPSKAQVHLKDSAILGGLNAKLPAPNKVLQGLNALIDPNQSPQVFAGREPAPNAQNTLPSPRQYSAALAKAQQSVVKVEGLGCGGIVDGSGFVFASGLVATNAHVIAGVGSPKVQSSGKTYNTKVVTFDAANDIAILRVPELDAPPLARGSSEVAVLSPVFSLGFPGGGDYKVSPGVILDRFEALGQDIYGKNRILREVYSLQTNIVRGNSGGPVVGADGSLIGVVFATSTTYNNVGYALTLDQVGDILRSSEKSTTAVSSGTCSQ